MEFSIYCAGKKEKCKWNCPQGSVLICLLVLIGVLVLGIFHWNNAICQPFVNAAKA
jgi:hypothetical protein